MNYAASQFFVYATATGLSSPLDIVRFTCSYQRNSIPTATLMVPLGKEVQSWQSSQVYNLTPGAMARIRMQVHIAGFFGGGSWTGGTLPIVPGMGGYNAFTIFDGWLTGMGYHREREKVYATLDLTHWLADLNFASALCQSSNPSNPADLIFPADGVLPDTGVTHGATLNAKSEEYATPDNLANDFWGSVLKPWFAWFLSQNRLYETNFMAGAKQNDSVDGSASAALVRMNTGAYKLNFDAAVASLIQEGVVNDLTQNIADPDGEELSLANVTIWEKLVGHLVPTYHFDIIPRPGDALIRPVVPSFGGGYHTTLLARDQSVVKLNIGLQRPIRAVGLFVNEILSKLGFESTANNESLVIGFAETPTQPTGVVLFRQAPHFLVNAPTAPLTYIDFIDGYSDIINGPAQGVRGFGVRESFEPLVTVGNKLAQIMYNEEALKERNGVIAGPLRFDICPGSTVRIQGVENTNQYAFGLVQSTNCFIDSDAQQAATAFQLAYIRSSAENSTPLMTSSSHGLFDSVWAGDTLFTPHSGYAWNEPLP